MILLDSSAWIEFLVDGPRAGRIERLLSKPADVLTPTLVLYEVYKKLKREKGEEAALSAVAQLQQTTVEPLDDSTALSAADLSLAYDIPMADAVIAASAKNRGARVVTLDADFKKIPWAEVL